MELTSPCLIRATCNLSTPGFKHGSNRLLQKSLHGFSHLASKKAQLRSRIAYQALACSINHASPPWAPPRPGVGPGLHQPANLLKNRIFSMYNDFNRWAHIDRPAIFVLMRDCLCQYSLEIIIHRRVHCSCKVMFCHTVKLRDFREWQRSLRCRDASALSDCASNWEM